VLQEDDAVKADTDTLVVSITQTIVGILGLTIHTTMRFNECYQQFYQHRSSLRSLVSFTGELMVVEHW